MAVKRWIGAAAKIAQIDNITIGGTWATGDKATITINGSSLTLTVGTATTTANVASALSASVNAATAYTDLIGTETRNVGGQEIREMSELQASVSGSVVLLTTQYDYNGWPFTISVSKVSASGTIVRSANQVATGPNFVDNAINWEGSVLPTADGDVIRFDSGSESMLFALDYFVTSTTATSFEFIGDFIGQIGLPPVNASRGYPEYRPRFLQMYNTGVNSNYVRFLKGSKGLTNHSDIYLYGGAAVAGWTDLSSFDNRGSSADVPSVYVKGGTFDDIRIFGGKVEFDPAHAAALSGNVTVMTTFRLGALISESTVLVIVNEGTSVSDAEDVKIHGGKVFFYGNLAYGGVGNPTFDVYGGQVYIAPPDGLLTLRDITMHAGVLYPNHRSGSGRKITLVEGVLDMRLSHDTSNYDKVVMYKGSEMYDPAGLCTNEINLVSCDLQDVVLQIPNNRKLTLTTAAT